MFLFIGASCLWHEKSADSNTSYVLIYRIPRGAAGGRSLSFKYILCSYLSFHILVNEQLPKLFKYILCSYLSVRNGTILWERCKFKYILCSYLSTNPEPIPTTLAKFKYILCSYLSCLRLSSLPIVRIQIHPMFLFIALLK